ncbi:MAG: hypothetical protein PHV36_09825 [Elusimicrobiales bacterium]|nr:hypothetical protein [Elusimicrobiales bacterium]
MDDRDNKISKPGMPPLPPGMFKPNLPLPPGGAKPAMPPLPQPSFGAMPSPGLPQFSQPQKDNSAQLLKEASDAEARRMQEDKDKLEKKISDMEKMLSQEKEKALLATLKNQQDEALSSRVESSLKDIQEKMRRDRRDHEVEEERLTLKGKIKEMESRLSQERETWMQTLKNQMSERETQGKDVEGHFIYRLQEMERRWLDEKAQWQKEISTREETIRSLKTASEKLREVEDEYRKLSMEKEMAEREASKLRDEVARAEREKASIESYIKMMPEKEREIADLRSENISLRAREDTARMAAIHQEEKNKYEMEKLRKEIGDLQSDIGTISDRKNAEKNEELKKEQARFESQLQEKDKVLADVSGEKVRAISELIKIKGFVSRVQAINAVLDKERGQLKLEKMQLAQNMAAQLEELRRLKQENDGLKAAHQAELLSQAESFKAEINRVKSGYAAELTQKHAEEISELIRVNQEEAARLAAAHQQELSKVIAARQAEAARLAAERQAEATKTAGDHQAELSRLAAERQAETAKMAVEHQAELARMTAEYQNGLARHAAERQAEFDTKISQMRMHFEAATEEEKNAIKRQLESSGAAHQEEARKALSAALDNVVRLESENRRLAASAAEYDRTLAVRIKEFEDRISRADAEARRQDAEVLRQEAQAASALAQKAEAEKAAREAADERQRLSGEYGALREKFPVLEVQKAAAEAESARLAASLKAQEENLRLESENRARFESELLFLKQKIQQMELQSQENESQLDVERTNLAGVQAAAEAQRAADTARIEELSSELESYKAMEASLADRLKWAIKGKQE